MLVPSWLRGSGRTACWSLLVLAVPGTAQGGPATSPPGVEVQLVPASAPLQQDADGAGSRDARAEDAAADVVPFDREAVLDLVWAGGRAPQPGLPSARRVERDRERAEHRARLEELAASSPEHARRLAELLRDVVADESAPAPLVTAALRVAGSLGVREVTDVAVARLADPDRPGVAARRALHELYGVWLRDEAEARAFLDGLAGDAVPAPVRERLAAFEARERRALVALAKLDPASVTFDHLDPRVRTDLARALLVADAPNGDVDPVERSRATAVSAFAALAVERDPEAFTALLDLVLACFETGAVPTERWDELVAYLDTVQARRPDERALGVARAFARIPWQGLGPKVATCATEGAEGGLARIGRALEGLLKRRVLPVRPDADAVVGVLSALGTLADRVRNSGGPDASVALVGSAAHAPLLALVEDREAAVVTRAAAVGTLRRFAGPADAERLFEVLSAVRGEPQLAHAVLGCLGAVLAEHGAAASGAESVVARLAALLGDDDPNLRRQAVGLLGDERLAPLVVHVPAELLVSSLDGEDLEDLATSKLRLVGRLGSPQQLDDLLGLPNFDLLVGGGPAQREALIETLEKLSAGSHAGRFRVARRLLAVDHPESRLSRLRRVVASVGATLSQDAVQLERAEHEDLVRWAWELHAGGVDVAGAAPGFGQRLADLHLPALEAVPADAPLAPELAARRAHLAAVLASRVESADVDAVSALVDVALARGEEAGDRRLVALASRDRARFLAAVGESHEAVLQLRELEESDVLQNSDLRLAVELLATDTDPPWKHADEAFEWLWRLVRRPSWRSETAAVRWKDLEDLLTWAERTGDAPTYHLRFGELFADLPLEGEVDPEVAAKAVWGGLEREKDGVATLRALVARGRLAETPTEVTGAATAEPPPTPPTDDDGNPPTGG